jgi:hypothetical protein
VRIMVVRVVGVVGIGVRALGAVDVRENEDIFLGEVWYGGHVWVKKRPNCCKYTLKGSRAMLINQV